MWMRVARLVTNGVEVNLMGRLLRWLRAVSEAGGEATQTRDVGLVVE